MKTCRSYIAGNWHNGAAEEYFELSDPADQRVVVSKSLHAGPADAVSASRAASQAWPHWRSLAVSQRVAFVERLSARIAQHAESFAETISLETGKTLEEAAQEVDATELETRTQLDIFRQGSVEAIGSHRISYEPLGVVLLITPSNFPLSAIMRKLVPALLAGNTAVVKASELTPQTSVKLFELVDDLGVEPGVANLLIADGRDSVPAMVNSGVLAAISVTGSTETGDAILKVIGRRNIRFQAEMGGSNAVVVLADANIAEAADAVVQHGFACCGQWCTGTTRVIVEASVMEEFTQVVLHLVKQIAVGPATDLQTRMGPLISGAHLQRVEDAVKESVKEGARVIAGGQRPVTKHLSNGNYYEPTVLTDIGDYEAFCDREIFGPVIALIRAADVADALQKANTGHYGLSFSVFTGDMQVAEHFVSQVNAGMCHINLPTGYRDNGLPLSGWNESGRGIPECGRFARDFFTRTKAIYHATGQAAPV